jgi:DNA-binding CsgD family transcriptional regulator/tetratricopeptide (TPR) repeat protein
MVAAADPAGPDDMTPIDLLERDDALRHAGDVLSQAQRGHGATLLVSGEAGIGKSSFIGALLAGLGGRQRVLWGSCEDLHSPRPLGPLHDIAQQQRGALLHAVESGATAAQLFDTFFALLDSPVVCSIVVFEDVHWADQATLDLIKFVGRRIAALPVVLVLSYRADEVDSTHPLQLTLGDLPSARVERISLQPLSPAAVARLAAGAGRPHAKLHSSTGGNPFYVTEVLASGIVDASEGVPSTVRDAVLSRLGRLTSPQRAVVDALSVVPGRTELRLARTLISPAHADSIDGCIARGVLVVHDNTLAFRHELARRAAADALSPMHRIELHRRVLEALTDLPAGTPGALARLAHHAAEAGDAARVLELAPRAAREAAAVGAHREAALQYGAALRFAEAAPPQQQAQLHESWAYEAGLALGIDASVIAARHRALTLWRALQRADKVGHNLRWLSRLHWYEGDQARAERYAEEAVAVLEPLPPGPELAWAYSVRSQLHMLQDRTDAAVQWGERAIALAETLNEPEIRCHALNNVGTALLFAHRPGGREMLEQSLALALAHGFHEQAARVYTNVSEHAVVFKDYARAERMLDEGIAFDRRHDLDAWTHYLVGWLAELRLGQGRLDEAERIAREVLQLPRLTVVMRLPALTVLARVRMRRGEDDAAALLDAALAAALPTGEAQRIVPLATAMAEAAWLRGDLAACAAALEPVRGLAGAGVNPWEVGELAAWRQRAGQAAEIPAHAAAPWRLELQGRPRDAADAWLALGAPNEAALALLQTPADDPDALCDALHDALRLCAEHGASAAAARARTIARAAGLRHRLPSARRGAYGVARVHPQGLTAREQQVLALMVEGQRNAGIARRLGVTERTAERHVSAVIAKLGATDRHDAVARYRASDQAATARPR